MANSVSKLSNHNGIEGFGKYVYEELEKNESDAQAVSQLAAIFVNAEIFNYNGQLKNMRFWLKNIDWEKRLNNYLED